MKILKTYSKPYFFKMVGRAMAVLFWVILLSLPHRQFSFFSHQQKVVNFQSKRLNSQFHNSLNQIDSWDSRIPQWLKGKHDCIALNR